MGQRSAISALLAGQGSSMTVTVRCAFGEHDMRITEFLGENADALEDAANHLLAAGKVQIIIDVDNGDPSASVIQTIGSSVVKYLEGTLNTSSFLQVQRSEITSSLSRAIVRMDVRTRL